MVKLFEHKKAISVLKEIPTEGHSPLLLIADDYEQYIVKSTRAKQPDYCLINEFLCHNLLNCWRIPTPDVAIINVNSSILPNDLSHNNRPKYFENICFGSKYCKDVIELHDFISPDGNFDLAKFTNIDVLFDIALFDIWVENDDRKPKNNNILLQVVQNKYTIIAIDHSFVFSTMMYKDLDPKYIASSYNDTILHSPLGLSLLKRTKKSADWLKKVEESYYLCIENCRRNYDGIFSAIPAELGFNLDLSNNIYDFLFNEERNKLVFTEFISRLEYEDIL